MKLTTEVFHRNNLFFSQIVVLELLDAIFFVFHPQNSIPIEIKRHINFRYFKLSMSPNLIICNINFIEIILLLLQISSFIKEGVRNDYLFWVGKAQKITYFNLYIIVIEWEQMLLEWDLTILICWSLFSPKSLIKTDLSPIEK